MTELRSGHASGHVRNTFIAAAEAFHGWRYGTPQPNVSHEVNCEPHDISLADACRLVWNCTDVIPGDVFDILAPDLAIGRRTYAACARAMYAKLH